MTMKFKLLVLGSTQITEWIPSLVFGNVCRGDFQGTAVLLEMRAAPETEDN